jgi:hypothetical protein
MHMHSRATVGVEPSLQDLAQRASSIGRGEVTMIGDAEHLIYYPTQHATPPRTRRISGSD